MGLFALRAAAGPAEFLAVSKSITAADTPARNNDTLPALVIDGATDMGKMVVDFLLHDRQVLGNLQRIHIRPAQEIDHLPTYGLMLFSQGPFFHLGGVVLFLPCRVFLNPGQYLQQGLHFWFGRPCKYILPFLRFQFLLKKFLNREVYMPAVKGLEAGETGVFPATVREIDLMA